MPAAILTREGFERAIQSILERAHTSGRWEDVQRIVGQVEASDSPQEVSQLAALTYLVDEEYRLPMQESIEAYRRWCEKKGSGCEDRDIISILRSVYVEFQGSL